MSESRQVSSFKDAIERLASCHAAVLASLRWCSWLPALMMKSLWPWPYRYRKGYIVSLPRFHLPPFMRCLVLLLPACPETFSDEMRIIESVPVYCGTLQDLGTRLWMNYWWWHDIPLKVKGNCWCGGTKETKVESISPYRHIFRVNQNDYKEFRTNF